MGLMKKIRARKIREYTRRLTSITGPVIWSALKGEKLPWHSYWSISSPLRVDQTSFH